MERDLPEQRRREATRATKINVWYRYEDVRYAAYDPWAEFDQPVGPGRLEVKLREIPVLREMPKGVWLDMNGGRGRLVLRDSYKRYACPTIDEAKMSFLARKEKEARIHEARSARAREAIRLAGTLFDKENRYEILSSTSAQS